MDRLFVAFVISAFLALCGACALPEGKPVFFSMLFPQLTLQQDAQLLAGEAVAL